LFEFGEATNEGADAPTFEKRLKVMYENVSPYTRHPDVDIAQAAIIACTKHLAPAAPMSAFVGVAGGRTAEQAGIGSGVAAGAAVATSSWITSPATAATSMGATPTAAGAAATAASEYAPEDFWDVAAARDGERRRDRHPPREAQLIGKLLQVLLQISVSAESFQLRLSALCAVDQPSIDYYLAADE
jgi:hypothetical protein